MPRRPQRFCTPAEEFCSQGVVLADSEFLLPKRRSIRVAAGQCTAVLPRGVGAVEIPPEPKSHRLASPFSITVKVCTMPTCPNRVLPHYLHIQEKFAANTLPKCPGCCCDTNRFAHWSHWSCKQERKPPYVVAAAVNWRRDAANEPCQSFAAVLSSLILPPWEKLESCCRESLLLKFCSCRRLVPFPSCHCLVRRDAVKSSTASGSSLGCLILTICFAAVRRLWGIDLELVTPLSCHCLVRQSPVETKPFLLVPISRRRKSPSVGGSVKEKKRRREGGEGQPFADCSCPLSLRVCVEVQLPDHEPILLEAQQVWALFKPNYSWIHSGPPKNVITLESQELTPPQLKKPLVTLERPKVVEPQKITEEQPPYIAPVTVKHELPPSTSSNNTMRQKFQQLLVERQQFHAKMKKTQEQLNSLQKTMQAILARLPNASRVYTSEESWTKRHSPRGHAYASSIASTYAQYRVFATTSAEEHNRHCNSFIIECNRSCAAVPIPNIQIPTHPLCLATTSLSSTEAMQQAPAPTTQAACQQIQHCAFCMSSSSTLPATLGVPAFETSTAVNLHTISASSTIPLMLRCHALSLSPIVCNLKNANKICKNYVRIP